MTWVIQSKDEITGLVGENRYETDAGFRAALRDLFGNPKKQFISGTLPDGKELDEVAAKALVGGFEIGKGAIGMSEI